MLKEYMEVKGYGDAAAWVYREAMGSSDRDSGQLLTVQEVRHIHHLAMAPENQHIFSTCIHSARTIPMLTHDKHQPEKYDTQGEDHCADAAVYGCLSRPYTPENPADKAYKPRDKYKHDEAPSSWAL